MATNAETVIQVEGLHTRFGARVVHEGLSFAVQRGEVFALAGASGGGKSTLLRELIALHRPDRGRLTILDVDVLDADEPQLTALRRRCGVMFQRGALFSGLTLTENVAAPLKEHMHLSASLVRELARLKLALVGLPADSADKYPSAISGGMIKRAALARALALDPEILFLDEPTAGLDPMSAAGIDELVKELNAWLGITVVLVTHDLDSLWSVANRVAVLGTGHMLGLGSMQQLMDSDDPFVQQYFRGPRGHRAQPT